MEEKLSLASRFGVSINFANPTRKEFHEIVLELAHKQGITGYSDDELCALANRWELRHSGICGRTAQQFVNHLYGKTYQEKNI